MEETGLTHLVPQIGPQGPYTWGHAHIELYVCSDRTFLLRVHTPPGLKAISYHPRSPFFRDAHYDIYVSRLVGDRTRPVIYACVNFSVNVESISDHAMAPRFPSAQAIDASYTLVAYNHQRRASSQPPGHAPREAKAPLCDSCAPCLHEEFGSYSLSSMTRHPFSSPRASPSSSLRRASPEIGRSDPPQAVNMSGLRRTPPVPSIRSSLHCEDIEQTAESDRISASAIIDSPSAPLPEHYERPAFPTSTSNVRQLPPGLKFGEFP